MTGSCLYCPGTFLSGNVINEIKLLWHYTQICYRLFIISKIGKTSFGWKWIYKYCKSIRSFETVIEKYKNWEEMRYQNFKNFQSSNKLAMSVLAPLLTVIYFIYLGTSTYNNIPALRLNEISDKKSIHSSVKRRND